MLRKVISVDFDGTLCTSNYPYTGKQKWIHKLLLKWILRQQKKGTIIILNTLRTDSIILSRAIEWCNTKGFYPDYINENAVQNIDKFGDSRKIGADLHIDDKNIGIFGWILRKIDDR